MFQQSHAHTNILFSPKYSRPASDTKANMRGTTAKRERGREGGGRGGEGGRGGGRERGRERESM